MSAVPDWPNGGNYAEYADSVLEQATPVSLAGATAPILSIWTQHSLAATSYVGGCCHYDYGYVEYSTNYGLTWTKLSNPDAGSPDGNGPGFTGTVSSWTQELFDLTKITNWQTLPILIRFRLWDNGDNAESLGWLVDEPEIYDGQSGNKYFGPDTFASGSLPNFGNVTLTATPNTNYTFDSWTGCNSTSGNECTINRYIDRVVTATFTPCTSCNTQGIITPKPTSLNFGEHPIDTTSTAKKVTVTDTGTGTISSLTATATPPFAISGNTCGASLAVKAKCTVSITFSPTALGEVSGTLTLTGDNASNSPQTVTLAGSGEAQATLTPPKHTFPKTKVGTTSAAAVFTLKNNLSTALTGVSPTTTGDFKISSTTCTATLAAKSSCKIDVTFTPTATGKRTGTLSVADSAVGSPQTASLSGTGD